MIDKSTFSDIIKRDDVREYINSLSDIESLFGGELAATRGYDQRNPHHCYTLLDHMLTAVELLDVTDISDEDAEILRTALFFHDIGKPRCAKPKEDRLTFSGHAQISRDIARPILAGIGFSDHDVSRISFFIEYHDIFLTLRLANDADRYRSDDPVISAATVGHILQSIRDDAAKNATYYPSDHDFDLMPRLCMADSMAQAEVTYRDGHLRDTRENKIARVNEIGRFIHRFTHRSSENGGKCVCIFGASSDRIPQKYKDAAIVMGRLLAKNRLGMVFGAGGHGVMGAAARGAHEENGAVTGVVPKKLYRPGIPSPYCTEILITPTMHERKALMESLSMGFIAMAGGFGTLEELLEIITLKQLGYHDLPIAILNTDGYFNDLVNMFGTCADEGFADREFLGLYKVCTSPDEAIEYILNYKPQKMPDKLS